MIKKIINKVRAFNIALHTGIPNQIRQQKSLDILLKMFELGFFFPLSPWAMNSTPYARYSAIPYLKNKLNNSFALFLDDAKRKHESEIFEQWQKDLNCDSLDCNRYIYMYKSVKFGTVPS